MEYDQWKKGRELPFVKTQLSTMFKSSEIEFSSVYKSFFSQGSAYFDEGMQ